jgi:hypothetical protein
MRFARRLRGVAVYVLRPGDLPRLWQWGRMVVGILGLAGLSIASAFSVAWGAAILFAALALLLSVALYRLYVASLRTFPRVWIHVPVVTDDSATERVTLSGVRVTNQEEKRRVRLAFSLKVQLPADIDVFMDLWATAASVPGDSDPITVEPMDGLPVHDQVYEWPQDRPDELHEVLWFLTVSDHVTHESVTFRVPGGYLPADALPRERFDP